MKRQTRAFLLNILTGIAVAAAAALVLLPTTASAAPAYTTSEVNLRQVPNGPVIVAIGRGQQVDVRACNGGWCQVIFRGTGGYVSQQYLSNTATGPSGSFSFGVTGPNGNTIRFGVNVPPPDSDPIYDDEPIYDGEACFFSRSQKRGESFCVQAGDNIPDLGGWANEISSIDNIDGLDVTICTRTRFRGDCRTYTTGANSLGRFDNAAVSLRVD